MNEAGLSLHEEKGKGGRDHSGLENWKEQCPQG